MKVSHNIAIVTAVSFLGLQVGLWTAFGRSTLDDTFHVSQLQAVVEAEGEAPSRYFLCEPARSELTEKTLSRTMRLLKTTGVDWITEADLAPVGVVEPSQCECFATCLKLTLNTPFVGVVESNFRPNLTYSERGGRWMYLFIMGKWVRFRQLERWSQW